MKKVKKTIKHVASSPKGSEKSNKTQYKDFDFLTEVLACMAWTTKA
ncbi:MAG: hypothetical protein PVG20_07545 [Thioalkalispiraceae bacterium]|jgi:hypothetical protein